MSCGEHHDVDCSEILQRVYVFIDNELEDFVLNGDNECGLFCVSKHIPHCVRMTFVS